MKTPQAKLTRRKFLLAVTAGTAASAATVVTKNQADKQDTRGPDPEKKGYQVTEHVRNYYRTARI